MSARLLDDHARYDPNYRRYNIDFNGGATRRLCEELGCGVSELQGHLPWYAAHIISEDGPTIENEDVEVTVLFDEDTVDRWGIELRLGFKGASLGYIENAEVAGFNMTRVLEDQIVEPGVGIEVNARCDFCQ